MNMVGQLITGIDTRKDALLLIFELDKFKMNVLSETFTITAGKSLLALNYGNDDDWTEDDTYLHEISRTKIRKEHGTYDLCPLHQNVAVSTIHRWTGFPYLLRLLQRLSQSAKMSVKA